MKPSREVQKTTQFQPTFQNVHGPSPQGLDEYNQGSIKAKVNLIRVQGINEIGSKNVTKFNVTQQQDRKTQNYVTYSSPGPSTSKNNQAHLSSSYKGNKVQNMQRMTAYGSSLAKYQNHPVEQSNMINLKRVPIELTSNNNQQQFSHPGTSGINSRSKSQKRTMKINNLEKDKYVIQSQLDNPIGIEIAGRSVSSNPFVAQNLAQKRMQIGSTSMLKDYEVQKDDFLKNDNRILGVSDPPAQSKQLDAQSDSQPVYPNTEMPRYETPPGDIRLNVPKVTNFANNQSKDQVDTEFQSDFEKDQILVTSDPKDALVTLGNPVNLIEKSKLDQNSYLQKIEQPLSKQQQQYTWQYNLIGGANEHQKQLNSRQQFHNSQLNKMNNLRNKFVNKKKNLGAPSSSIAPQQINEFGSYIGLKGNGENLVELNIQESQKKQQITGQFPQRNLGVQRKSKTVAKVMPGQPAPVSKFTQKHGRNQPVSPQGQKTKYHLQNVYGLNPLEDHQKAFQDLLQQTNSAFSQGRTGNEVLAAPQLNVIKQKQFMNRRAQIQTSPSNLDMNKLSQPLYDMQSNIPNKKGNPDAFAVKSLKEIQNQADGKRMKVVSQNSQHKQNQELMVQKLPQLQIGGKRSVSQKRDAYNVKNHLNGIDTNSNKRSLSNLNKINSQRKLIEQQMKLEESKRNEIRYFPKNQFKPIAHMFLNERHSPYTSDILTGSNITTEISAARPLNHTRDGYIKLDKLPHAQIKGDQQQMKKFQKYNPNYYMPYGQKMGMPLRTDPLRRQSIQVKDESHQRGSQPFNGNMTDQSSIGLDENSIDSRKQGLKFQERFSTDMGIKRSSNTQADKANILAKIYMNNEKQTSSQTRSNNFKIVNNQQLAKNEQQAAQKFDEKIEISLKRIDDKFNHLNLNLQKYQEILKPAIEQLDGASPYPMDSFEDLDRSKVSSKMDGILNNSQIDITAALLNSSRRVISTEHEQLSHAIFTNTSQGKIYNLDDTIPDVSQTDPQSSDCPQAQMINHLQRSNHLSSSRMTKKKVPPLHPLNMITHRNMNGNASPLILANIEDFSQLDSVQEVHENIGQIQKYSSGVNNDVEVPLIPMGSFNGMLNDQFDATREVGNLDTANKEVEHRRRALKSQGQSRPFNKQKRTNLKKVINQAREGQNPQQTYQDEQTNQEMTIHDIMSIDRVQQTGQKTQR